MFAPSMGSWMELLPWTINSLPEVIKELTREWSMYLQPVLYVKELPAGAVGVVTC